MYYLTLSWDDGFLKSSLKTAEIYERYGLRAEFNVIATAHLPDNALPANMQPGQRWGAAFGDFALRNDLQARGHVIQPHGYRHAHKSGGSGELYYYDLATSQLVFVQQLPLGIYTSADLRDREKIYFSHFGSKADIWLGNPRLFVLHVPPRP